MWQRPPCSGEVFAHCNTFIGCGMASRLAAYPAYCYHCTLIKSCRPSCLRPYFSTTTQPNGRLPIDDSRFGTDD
ncbi:MAG: hypothetical protein GY805_37315 [Chloroflexi bacterium]|nr:hypothetical protein [Chloroflexota bacterium]